MPTINTKDLTGAALDWAVAKCEDDYSYRCFDGRSQPKYQGAAFYLLCWKSTRGMRYSTNPAQGHPIIEREDISLIKSPSRAEWQARKYTPEQDENANTLGPTALIAALRCHVAARLGPTVDVPQELLP